MKTADILKVILESQGMITIKDQDIQKAKDKDIALIETWDDQGNRSYTIYTHQTRKK
jgi:hypothetical protein